MIHIKSFLEKIAQAWIRQLPLFVMLILYTTLPTFFTIIYSCKTYLLFVVPQAVLPSLLLCLIADRRRWLWWTVFILGNLLWLMEVGCYFCHNQRMCSPVAILIAQSNPGESVEYLSSVFPNLVKGVLTAAICTCVAYVFDRCWRKVSEKIIIKLQERHGILMKSAGLLLVLSVIYSLTTLYRATCQDQGYKVRMMFLKSYASASCWIMYAYTLNDLFNNPDMNTIPMLKESMESAEVTLDSPKDSLAIVYVIGESFPRSRSSLYGYPYDTNPLMAKELADSSLVIFDNVISMYYWTMFAYRTLLSTCNLQDDTPFEDYPLLPALMKKEGYKVGYFDNQEILSDGHRDFTTTYFISDKDVIDLCFDIYSTEGNEYDGDFVNCHPPLAADGRGNSLTIYHLMGQHFTYDSRYPEKFRHFTKDHYSCFENLSERGAITMSEFDNATRYNDYVIHSIIDRLRDKNAVLIYSPDHGEEAFDYREASGRGDDVPVTSIRLIFEVPVMIWMSDSFRQKYPDIVAALRNNTGKAIYNSDLSHTILDIAGISTPTFNPEVSLLREGTGRTHRKISIRGIDYDASRDEIYREKLRYE